MDLTQVENTLKKMGLLLEKVTQKIDEIDKRVTKLEEKINNSQQIQQSQSPTIRNFGSSFLGSLAGSMAGMGLYNLLFNNSISANEVAKELGIDENELADLDNKLSEVDEKLEEIDNKIDSLETQVEDDSFENTDYESDFDDMGFDEI